MLNCQAGNSHTPPRRTATSSRLWTISATVAGETPSVDSELLIADGSATNCTVGCVTSTTGVPDGLTVTVIVFVSATVEAIEPVATPSASAGSSRPQRSNPQTCALE